VSVVNDCTGHVGHSRSVSVESSFCTELRLLIEAGTLESWLGILRLDYIIMLCHVKLI